MELRRYWTIFKRRWWLIAIPAFVVLVVGLATYKQPTTTYTAGVRFIVGQDPGREAAIADEQRYYNWLTSEYVVNGLADWARGGGFATAVSENLAAQGIDIPAGAIQGSIATDNVRSMLTLSMNYGNPDALNAMMTEAIAVLTTRNAEGLPQLDDLNAELVLLDDIHVNPVSAGVRSQLDLPIRLLLAIGAGIGLALLVEYLDPTIRDRREVEAVGLQILGEIPRK